MNGISIVAKVGIIEEACRWLTYLTSFILWIISGFVSFMESKVFGAYKVTINTGGGNAEKTLITAKLKQLIYRMKGASSPTIVFFIV